MSNFNRIHQTDSPSLSIGEFHTSTGRARQTAAPKNKYVLAKHPMHVRGTPEYNPLYDAVDTNISAPFQRPPSDFRPITPVTFRVVNNRKNDFESTYDKPRSHHHNTERSQQQQLSSRSPIKESVPASELDLLMENRPNETCIIDVEDVNQKKRRRRRRILYNLFDFLAIVATCVIFALIYVLVPPVQRGFFCDDTTIQYPYKHDTVPMWLLGVYGGVAPIIIFCFVELWVVRPFHCGRGTGGRSQRERLIDYLKVLLHTICLFILGIAVCFLITEVGKRTIGRLRPHYLAVCNPDWSKINCTKTVMTASGPAAIPLYVQEHHCTTTATYFQLREAQLSFPSGHSSYSTYAFIFLFVYFEARLVCPKVQFVKPFLQCLCVATAFFTCLSRVTDYKHHPTDVIAGALIGFCIAVFSAVRVGTYLWETSIYCETDDETQKDRLPPDERIAFPGMENKPSTGLQSNNPLRVSPARERNSSRSNYDNVASIQTQQRMTSGQRNLPARNYDEANV